MVEADAATLQLAMQSGKTTSLALVRAYLARIRTIDKSGPCINSVIELNPDALRIARELDRERKAGKERGPLHGIPVLMKDNIATMDAMQTTAGSLALVAAAVAGYPHITVPAGFVSGLPVGISFVGTAWSEPKLIAMAYTFEQATKNRRAPGYLKTARV